MSSQDGHRAGNGIFARAMRGSAFVAGGFVASQLLRLVSNLLLTRLLFPEAFGLMALVAVVITGLTMFSDVGLGPSIMSSRRGDEPRFLDTAWTIAVGRGLILWLVACAVAWPLAQFYGAPELAAILPVAGFALVIGGFTTNRIETANRHLVLGLVTLLDLAAQVAGIALMALLAWVTGSVWALVWGGLATALIKLVLATLLLPGHRNRFGWDASAARELIRFGGWIFLSTACGFMLAQGDKAILGRFLSLDALGVYNVGFFLASFPMALTLAVVSRIFLPVYREVGADGSAQAGRRLRRMRFAVTGLAFGLLAFVALLGVPLVGLLYDARYAAAGAIAVAIACVQLPQMLIATYDQAALAAGDSRGFFLVIALRAGMQTLLFLLGAHWAGLTGALAGQALAAVLCLPASLVLARRHNVHDPRHDLTFGLLALLLAAVALWHSQDALKGLSLM